MGVGAWGGERSPAPGRAPGVERKPAAARRYCAPRKIKGTRSRGGGTGSHAAEGGAAASPGSLPARCGLSRFAVANRCRPPRDRAARDPLLGDQLMRHAVDEAVAVAGEADRRRVEAVAG